jgi:hypothetical protein
LVAVILGVGALSAESDGGKRRRFEANLKGIYEVGANNIGAVSTIASGSFRATLSEDGTSISYRLRYSDLEADITQSHIHVGQFHTAGGISVWLCQTATNPSPTADTPMCPDPRSGVVEGTLTAANVIGPAGQGVAAGEFAELARLLRSGVTYANVHSLKFPGGEIRGQIRED